MKKVIYVFLWFCLYLQGCEQKVEYQYDDVNRIYFQYEVLNSLGNKVSLDSVVFSFDIHAGSAMRQAQRFPYWYE